MNSSLGNEIVTGFIGEVEGYLPDMSRCLQTLQQDRTHRASLAELHRITHTIKGAAAMVGLNDLSGIGEVLERVMENLLGSSLDLNDEIITLLGDATHRIDSYCTMQREGRPDDGHLFLQPIAELEEKVLKQNIESGREEQKNEMNELFSQYTEEEDDDLFAALDNEEPEEADSFFDELDASASPDLQNAEEEDNLFNAPAPEAPEQTPVQDEPIPIDPELLQCFQEETEDHLENIDTCLNSLEEQITVLTPLTPSTQETLHSLRRSVHTLKGAAAVIGIEQVAAWGHDFEDFLDWLYDEARQLDPATLVTLRDGADLLASLAENPGLPSEKDTQRIATAFNALTTKLSHSPLSDDEEKDEEPVDSVLAQRANGPEERDSLDNDTSDIFAELDNEEPEETESFFDELAESASPELSSDPKDKVDELFFQDTKEKEDDFFDTLALETPELQENTEHTQQTRVEDGTAAIDPELLQCFQEETEDHLENIDRCLNTLEEQITALEPLSPSNQETLHSLRRSVHTLKGAAAVIGIEKVAAWGHDFEDFLDWLHDEARQLDPATLVTLRDGADLLASLAENPGLPSKKDTQRIVTAFKNLTTRLTYSPLPDDEEKDEEPVDSAIAQSTHEGTEESDTPGNDTDDLFAALDNEEPEQADSFFDELASSPPSSEEEADLFESVVAGLSEDSGDSENYLVSAQETEVSQDDTVIEAIDPELLECFHEEAEEHLDNIDRQVNHLSATISDKAELTDLRRKTLHSIRRSVHTLKGAAAVIGIEQIAAWGHDFEDFLDWLHDEAQLIHPDIVTAMQESADLLMRLVEDPTCSVHTEQQTIQQKIQEIIANKNNITSAENIFDEEPVPPSEQVAEKNSEPTVVAPARQQRAKSTTLRVDINRIDQLVGLSGDMVINLSSFEDAMSTMSGTMKELDMILQRLKNINSSLEAGYELASIPHLGSMEEGQLSGMSEDFDPLEMDRYSELNILIRSLTEAVSDLDSIMAQNALDNVNWQKTVEQQNIVLKDLQNRMLGIRMTPLSTLSGRMQRTVREAERTTGHPARLTIEGESIMMDTQVWDVMADPFMHLLRNAVAHGGRPLKKGHQEPLSITIKARRRGGLCTLQVLDNGKGLDYEAIRIKGMKLYPNDRVNLMSNNELAELIFRHGFSSTGAITNIAGRGVGMDVVRDAIEQLNGSIEVISEQGQGTEFIMRLPVAVAQLPAILARFGNQVYALPMHDVESVVRASAEEKKGREYSFNEENIPLLHPAEVAGFETGKIYVEENLTEEDQALLIVYAGRKRAALLCEQLIGQRDIVFKDLGSHLYNVPCIAGATIMGDGSLIPILQVEEILRTWTPAVKRPEQGQQSQTAKKHTQQQDVLRVLIVDDSISVRKVVSNLITQQGWIPVAARNGIEAIEKIREEKPNIVLLDVEMPRMNGFEVLQALQAQPELRDIPVAMLTSRSAEKYQKKARELGARGFMNKPFKADEVISFIRSVTPDKQVESL